MFIVNPEAGNGRRRAVFESLQKSEAFASLDVIVYYSEYAGHVEEIAHQLREDEEIQVVVIIERYGTIHEVVNGLYPRDLPIGFIPGGSGNDFARGIGLKGNPVEVLEEFIKSKQTAPYWIGSYQQDSDKERYFVNSMGFGFDAGSYVVAILQVLLQFKPRRFDIIIDEK